MRSLIRRSGRPFAAVAALATALLLAGCSSGGEGGGEGTRAAAPTEVFLQPVAAQGPDPFTASTAKAAPSRSPGTAPPASPAPSAPATAQPIREVTGSTPGLYGGTRSVASCDVEQQVAFLTADQNKARAFAEGAGIPETGLASWLRGLTPVLLRADTRVTNHGYRDGRATAFQSVLQAGTAVLVDQYGAPRVRCACGNPLRTPVAVQGAAHSGRPWSGYHPDRVVVIRPTTVVVNTLVIVNIVNNTWIERQTGSDGEKDKKPVVDPPCHPDECHWILPPTPDPTSPDPTSPDPTSPDPTSPDPSATDTSPSPDGSSPSTTPDDPTSSSPPPSTTDCPSPYASPRTPTAPGQSVDPYSPDPYTPSPDIPPGCPTPTWTPPDSPPTPEPPVEPETDLPSLEDLFPSETGPQQPETFEG